MEDKIFESELKRSIIKMSTNLKRMKLFRAIIMGAPGSGKGRPIEILSPKLENNTQMFPKKVQSQRELLKDSTSSMPPLETFFDTMLK